MNIINVPIESLEDRYSADWNRNFPQALSKLGPVHTVYPKLELSSTVTEGQFLNIVETNLFKSQQMAEICRLIRGGAVNDESVFFFHDAWFPGLESLFYIRDALKMKFKITGMFHAGTWDEFDFLSSSGMERWASTLEQTWLREMDLPIVSTQFHHDLISRKRSRTARLTVLPFPLWHLNDITCDAPKENIVVFPHRLANEKNPSVFDTVAKILKAEFPHWEFLKTKDVCATKAQYIDLLETSKIAVSCAQQETWGIAQLEATAAGCIPVVPEALSYPELYASCYTYPTETDCWDVPIEISAEALLSHLKSEIVRQEKSSPSELQPERVGLRRGALADTDPDQFIARLGASL